MAVAAVVYRTAADIGRVETNFARILGVLSVTRTEVGAPGGRRPIARVACQPFTMSGCREQPFVRVGHL